MRERSFYGWTGDASGTNNPLVVVVSSNRIVQANFGALPTVNVSPQNLIVLAGSNAVLNANAAGLPPLSYQWLKSSAPLDGATNATYAITNAQADKRRKLLGDRFQPLRFSHQRGGHCDGGIPTVNHAAAAQLDRRLPGWF